MLFENRSQRHLRISKLVEPVRKVKEVIFPCSILENNLSHYFKIHLFSSINLSLKLLLKQSKNTTISLLAPAEIQTT